MNLPRRSFLHLAASTMARRSEFENSLLEQVGRRPINLTIDDVGRVVGDALRDHLRAQRQQILNHVDRLFRLQKLTAGAGHDQRFKNLHKRLIEVEAEIRALKRGGAR
jgi:hypothetical protein